MSSARARFKYALRQCRLDEQCISSENLASSMQCHDVNIFWKNICLLKVLEKCTKNLIGHSRLAVNNHESNIDCYIFGHFR